MMAELQANLKPAVRYYWAELFLVAVFLVIGMMVAISEGRSLAGAVICLIGVLILLYVIIHRYSLEYTMSGDRIRRHFGIVFRQQHSVRVGQLRSVNIEQGIVDRIFNIGDIAFYTAGDKPELYFEGVGEPAEWRDRIEDALDHRAAS